MHVQRTSVLFVAALGALALAAPTAQAQARGRLSNEVEKLAEEHLAHGQAGAAAAARDAGHRVETGPGGPRLAIVLEPVGGDSSAVADADLAAIGADVSARSDSFVRALVPFGRLRDLADVPGVTLARTATRAKALGFGPIESQSVPLTEASLLHAAGVTGLNVKVAVVDLGFIGLQSAITAGELPASTVKVALPGQTVPQLESGTVHGTGVSEHLMDMAPGAELHVIRVDDEVDLENTAAYLATNGISIANHSVGWVNSSYYDDTGSINTIFNDSAADGVFWAVAAGNDAEMHWRGTWTDADADGFLEFAPGDEGLGLIGSGSGQVFLNWDQYGSSVTDIDLYVYNSSGQIVARSEGWQTGLQDPAEAVGFSFSPGHTIRVKRYAGPTAGLDLSLFSFYHDFEHKVPAASLMDPADASGVFSVAAIHYSDWNDPPGSVLPEPFSSHGPTTDGRMKPDIAAPDGTSSRTYAQAFGTSFSSPTTAGAAALLKQQDPTLTRDELALALLSSAVDVGAPGHDTTFGAGKLRVGSLNDPPTADGDSATTAEDTDVTVNVLTNDNDPNGDTLAVIAVTQGAHGSVTRTTASVTYSPASNFHGDDSFTYTCSDGHGGQATATVSITVTPVEDLPDARDDEATTLETDPVTIAVLVNDVDDDGDALSIVNWTQGQTGTVEQSGDSLVYTPTADGTDSFTYTISANGAMDTATVNVTIQRTNVNPVAVDDSATTDEDASVAIEVLDNDTDADGDVPTVVSFTQGAHGAVTGNGGTLTYAPALNWNQGDSFTYTISDGFGGSATGTVTITITPLNDAPVANPDSATTGAGINATIAVRGNDTDVDGDPLSLVDVSVTTGGGTASIVNGSVLYSPNGFVGTATLSYTITDGTAQATGTVTVTVTPNVTSVHVGDLDRASSSQGSRWTATVTVRIHDNNHALRTANVTGRWNSGETESGTATNGVITFSRTGIKNSTSSTTFTVQTVTASGLSYASGSNHDPDGNDESNGTVITIRKP